MKVISVAELQSSFVQRSGPIVVDARPEREYRAAAETIAGALRRDPEAVASWAEALPCAASVVVYGAQDGDAVPSVAKALEDRGIETRWLEGGLRARKARQGALDRKPAGGATRWVTRERPEIDRRYQQAVAAMGGGGGWPLSVFLTPDKEPFYGGTYFSPEDSQGTAAFKSGVKAGSAFYKTKKEQARS